MKLAYLIVAVIVFGWSPLFAQSPTATQERGEKLGKPFVNTDGTQGVVEVRVLRGEPTTPEPNMKVTLTVGKQTKTATTDEMGRTAFGDLPVGVKARLTIGKKDKWGTSETFTIPDRGSVSVMLSSRPWRVPARGISSVAEALDSVAAGAAEVRVTYDDLWDPKPPAGVAVTLVGYAADDHVTVQRTKTDAKGIARFTKLDTSGSVAYFALAQLPRNKLTDRLVSAPFTLEPKHGVQLTLSAALRTAPNPPIDDLDRALGQAPVATPRQKVRVLLDVNVNPTTPVEIFDAATGSSVAKGSVSKNEAVIDVRHRAGQVLYATVPTKQGSFRSLPFETVTDRGASVFISIDQRVVPTFAWKAYADDDALVVGASISLLNTSWSPYGPGGHGPTIQLPRGATNLKYGLLSGGIVLRNGVIELPRPLPPGTLELEVEFDVPAKKGVVDWSLDLPFGAFESSFYVEQEAGLSIDSAAKSLKVERKTDAQKAYLAIENITIGPQQSMVMTVTLPKPSPDKHLAHACRRLDPKPDPLVGTPIDFTLSRVDGGTLKLSALRGKPTLVATTSVKLHDVAEDAVPRLVTLGKEVPKLAIVLVSSGTDAKAVAKQVGTVPFPVVLDPPADPDDYEGAVTASWGLGFADAFLVDAKGVVRYKISSMRRWDHPDAVRCIKAFVGT
jgi:hypothetical protein